MAHKKHPYPGPVFTGAPLCGQVSIGANGAAVQGPAVTVNGAWLSVNSGTSTVSVNNVGTASVGVGGLPLSVTTPVYIPCSSLDQLFFVGSDSTKLVNYFAFV